MDAAGLVASVAASAVLVPLWGAVGASGALFIAIGRRRGAGNPPRGHRATAVDWPGRKAVVLAKAAWLRRW